MNGHLIKKVDYRPLSLPYDRIHNKFTEDQDEGSGKSAAYLASNSMSISVMSLAFLDTSISPSAVLYPLPAATIG